MTTGQTITDIEDIQAPWNKLVSIQTVAYEGGMSMFRLRIKEGKRFTDLELDPETAKHLAGLIQGWIAEQSS